MKPAPTDITELRRYRNSKLYRSLTRSLRAYNRRLIDGLRARGFEDFSPAFPALLSNLDVEGTRIGVLAARAGVTRQAAGQLIAEIERCGYVERRAASDDARATVVAFTRRGRQMLANVFELVEAIDQELSEVLGATAFERVREGLSRIADATDPAGAFSAALDGAEPETSMEAAGSPEPASRAKRAGAGGRRSRAR